MLPVLPLKPLRRVLSWTARLSRVRRRAAGGFHSGGGGLPRRPRGISRRLCRRRRVLRHLRIPDHQPDQERPRSRPVLHCGILRAPGAAHSPAVHPCAARHPCGRAVRAAGADRLSRIHAPGSDIAADAVEFPVLHAAGLFRPQRRREAVPPHLDAFDRGAVLSAGSDPADSAVSTGQGEIRCARCRDCDSVGRGLSRGGDRLHGRRWAQSGVLLSAVARLGVHRRRPDRRRARGRGEPRCHALRSMSIGLVGLALIVIAVTMLDARTPYPSWRAIIPGGGRGAGHSVRPREPAKPGGAPAVAALDGLHRARILQLVSLALADPFVPAHPSARRAVADPRPARRRLCSRSAGVPDLPLYRAADPPLAAGASRNHPPGPMVAAGVAACLAVAALGAGQRLCRLPVDGFACPGALRHRRCRRARQRLRDFPGRAISRKAVSTGGSAC